MKLKMKMQPLFVQRRRQTCLISLCVIVYCFAALALLILMPGHPDHPASSSSSIEDATDKIKMDIWNSPQFDYSPCVDDPSTSYTTSHYLDRYLLVQSNGGLNQMRSGIADMVAIARILNATLVIPKLDRRSYWKDSSTFSDIFDDEHFIKTLERDVHVIRELPTEMESVPRARKHFTTLAGLRYYENISNLWNNYKIINAAKSDSRLANNDLPLEIQKLRCHAIYNALKFAPSIESIAEKIVKRMRSRGPYIALHLRFEKDMLAFTGCSHGLSFGEVSELTTLRENTNHWKTKKINSTDQRLKGNCPLTPKEVGVFLRALGFPQNSWIYVAAGEIYGGTKYLSELKSQFPNIVFKETVTTKEELGTFLNHASQTAAIDYMVSIESDIFIPSYSGHMARAVGGHRRFLGHRRTITPDRNGLVPLFEKLESGELVEGPELCQQVIEMHKSRQGAPRKRDRSPLANKGRYYLRTEESFYENPFPECICKHSSGKSKET